MWKTFQPINCLGRKHALRTLLVGGDLALACVCHLKKSHTSLVPELARCSSWKMNYFLKDIKLFVRSTEQSSTFNRWIDDRGYKSFDTFSMYSKWWYRLLKKKQVFWIFNIDEISKRPQKERRTLIVQKSYAAFCKINVLLF